MLPLCVLIKGHILGLCLLTGYVDTWLTSLQLTALKAIYKAICFLDDHLLFENQSILVGGCQMCHLDLLSLPSQIQASQAS